MLAENGSVVELRRAARGSSTRSRPASRSSTASASATSQDVALRDRRHLSEDGVLIVVATLGGGTAGGREPPELIARGFAEPGEPLLDEMREEARARAATSCLADDVTEIKLLQEHLHDGARPARSTTARSAGR